MEYVETIRKYRRQTDLDHVAKEYAPEYDEGSIYENWKNMWVVCDTK